MMIPTPSQGVTQRDIARALGVSNATVSLALRDSDMLTRERREEIQAAAQQMGYRPNPAATELSRHKKNSTVAHSGRTGMDQHMATCGKTAVIPAI